MMKRSGHRIGLALAGMAALATAGCGSLVPGARDDNAASTNADFERPRVSSSAQPDYAPRPTDAACLAELGAAGARFDPLPDAYEAPGCNRLGTVQLSALAGDRARFAVSNIGPVQCDLAKAFGEWARFGVDRAARQILGSGLARIETLGSYSCRNVAGSQRRSAHAEADAIDVSAFVLKDGRRITLTAAWDGGSAAERQFLRTVHRSACKRFGTVLGPDYNRAHRDHLHLEGTATNFCR